MFLNYILFILQTPPPTIIKTIKAAPRDDDYMDSFGQNTVSPVPASPPRELTLCPITGKVLGQAEGEPTPVPSPDPEIDKKPMLAKQQVLAQQQQQHIEQTTIINEDGDLQQMMVNDDGSPILVTGEDGTIYQVAGKNEQGQTILIAQGSDGEQQCVYVTSDEGDEATNASGMAVGTAENSGILTLDTAVAEAIQQQQLIPAEQVHFLFGYFGLTQHNI